MNSNAIGVVELTPLEGMSIEGGKMADPRLEAVMFLFGMATAGYRFGHDVLGPLIFD